MIKRILQLLFGVVLVGVSGKLGKCAIDYGDSGLRFS